MDDGESVQYIGRRTHPHYEGRGYSFTLKRYADFYVREKFPGVKRFFSVTKAAKYTDQYLEKRRWLNVTERVGQIRSTVFMCFYKRPQFGLPSVAQRQSVRLGAERSRVLNSLGPTGFPLNQGN